MSTTVYQIAHSPFCIPITQALRACGVEFETREVPNGDRTEIIRLTSGEYYQVPVLVHEGQTVFETGAESQDVARFVDRMFAGGRLFPERLEGLQAIVIDFLENEVEGRTFRLVDPHYLNAVEDVAARMMIVRHKERKFGRGCVERWRREAAAIRAEADALLARFDTTLRHSPFLFGDAPTYSDFLLFGILGNLTWNGWNRMNAEQDALARWLAAMREFRY